MGKRFNVNENGCTGCGVTGHHFKKSGGRAFVVTKNAVQDQPLGDPQTT